MRKTAATSSRAAASQTGGSGLERKHAHLGFGERHARRVVRVARVGKQHRRAALGEREAELDDRRLGSGSDRDLALGIELDAVLGRVAGGDRLPQRAQAAEGRVPVCARVPGRLGESLDDVGWRTDLGVAATQIEDRHSFRGPGGGHAGQEIREVLLGKPLEPSGAGAHRRMVRPRPPGKRPTRKVRRRGARRAAASRSLRAGRRPPCEHG